MNTILVGHVALTSQSLVALGIGATFLAACASLSAYRRTFRVLDVPLAVAIGAAQILAVIWAVPTGGSGLGVVGLSWIFLAFLAGYALWRLAGGRPLRHWPWHRFGMLASLAVFLTDFGVALLMPVTPGHAWELGGAGARDALALLPPTLTAAFGALLSCGAPFTICAGECRKANRCRFGLDGGGTR